jgi:hypothetical protein
MPQDWGKEDDTMTRRRRHTPDQIIRKIAEGNKRLGGGTELDEVLSRIAENAGSRSPKMSVVPGAWVGFCDGT